MITAEIAPVLQEMFNEVAKERPSVGRVVRIKGRGKHHGKIGVVKQHFPSKYGATYRYGSDLQHHMLDARGRSGWCIQVEPFDGGPRFFANADTTMVCCE